MVKFSMVVNYRTNTNLDRLSFASLAIVHCLLFVPIVVARLAFSRIPSIPDLGISRLSSLFCVDLVASAPAWKVASPWADQLVSFSGGKQA